MQGLSSVLVLGSSALKIGEAGEFDYSGSQTLKALSEEGVRTILVNPNIATVQTSDHMADRIYFLPVTPHFVEKVIEKEKPEAILLGAGGQTALNCGAELYRNGILAKHSVRVLGTPVEAILMSEDREKFASLLKNEGLPVPRSKAAGSVEESLAAGKEIGYPCMARVAFALGGLGSGVCSCASELGEMAERAFAHTDQLLVEECLSGWKEIEYEVIRDRAGTCLTVCNMENLDPMGIHTGESIVVAPSQTLDNTEYHELRDAARKVASSLGVVGECNVQFALSPGGEGYRIIEANARLSRSSALASKATGYPLAWVAAKLSLGQLLHEVKNSVTGCTSAAFEPALDYVVVKMPRWDFEKFQGVSSRLGTSMKSVGEVMSIARSFEEALQKAIRMLQTGKNGLVLNVPATDCPQLSELSNPSHNRLFAIAECFSAGFSTIDIHDRTGIDPWFLNCIGNVVDISRNLSGMTIESLDRETLLYAKQHGFSDRQIAVALSCSEETIRNFRWSLEMFPCVKQIDTLAGEYPAVTNYLYLTYNGTENDVSRCSENGVIVLGSGTYCVGSSVEFDWSCVSTVRSLGLNGYSTIVINNNPETVSTDFDESHRLYFEELNLETVLDIYRRESPLGVVLFAGGQAANNLAVALMNSGVRILGTSPADINRAESRHTFSALLEKLKIPQPPWQEVKSVLGTREFVQENGFPVLVRPSYVLSGAAMGVAATEEQLDKLLQTASAVSEEHPVVLSKFIEGAHEIDLDGVAQNGEIITWALSEHVENAGIHSGDATLVFPPQRVYLETIRQSRSIAGRIASALNIHGPFNIQLLARNNRVMVIECNLRASRSFPFVSKVLNSNFISIASDVVMGIHHEQQKLEFFDLDYVGVKAPQFSFTRLEGADPVTGVEMASTGEVAALGKTFNEAYIKALMCVGFNLPPRRILVSLNGVESSAGMAKSLRGLQRSNTEIWAPPETSSFLAAMGIENIPVDSQKITRALISRDFDLVFSISDRGSEEGFRKDFGLRRAAADRGIPVMTSLQAARRLCEALSIINPETLQVKSYDEYTGNRHRRT